MPVGVFGLLFNKQAETHLAHALGHGGDADRHRRADVARRARRTEGARPGFGELWRMRWRWGWRRRWPIVPGCSRSGITISAGLFRNLTREAAARFAFLLSAPAIAGAAAKTLWDMHKHHELHGLLTAPFAVGVVVSAITGCLVIAWFLHYLRRSSLRLFVYYRSDFWHNSACSGFHPPASVMKLLSPTQHKRLNEAAGFLILSAGLVMLLSLVSYHTQDPSWDTAADARPLNLVGYPGSYLADLFLQVFGAAAFLFPMLAFALAWRWITLRRH